MSKQPRCIRSNSSLVKLNPVSCPCLDLLSAGKKICFRHGIKSHIYLFLCIFYVLLLVENKIP